MYNFRSSLWSFYSFLYGNVGKVSYYESNTSTFLISSIEMKVGVGIGQRLWNYMLYTPDLFMLLNFWWLIADRLTGYRRLLLLERFDDSWTRCYGPWGFNDFYLYAGLILLILGNGLLNQILAQLLAKCIKMKVN